MRKHDKLGVAGKEKSVLSLEVGKRISVDAAVEFAEGSVELTGPARERFQEFMSKSIGNPNLGNEELTSVEVGYLGLYLDGMLYA